MSLHVMLDLETMGVDHNSAIIAIGATKFDPLKKFEIADSFYVSVDPTDQERFGRVFNGSTVKWWMSKDRDAARAALMSSELIDLGSALMAFDEWFGSESLPLWGNGATFDNVIMRSAYKSINQPAPWEFWHDRCFRTLKNLVPKDFTPALPPIDGVAHHALYDAIKQTYTLQAIVDHYSMRVD